MDGMSNSSSHSSRSGMGMNKQSSSRFVMRPLLPSSSSRRSVRSISLVDSCSRPEEKQSSVREFLRSFSSHSLSNGVGNSTSIDNNNNKSLQVSQHRRVKDNVLVNYGMLNPSSGHNESVSTSSSFNQSVSTTTNGSSLSSIDTFFAGDEHSKITTWNPDDEASLSTNNTGDNNPQQMLVLPNMYQRALIGGNDDDDEVISLNPRSRSNSVNSNRSNSSGSSSNASSSKNSSRNSSISFDNNSGRSSQRSSMSAWSDARKKRREYHKQEKQDKKQNNDNSHHSETSINRSKHSVISINTPDNNGNTSDFSHNSSINSVSGGEESNSTTSRSRRSSLSAWSASQKRRQEQEQKQQQQQLQQQQMADSQHSNSSSKLESSSTKKSQLNGSHHSNSSKYEGGAGSSTHNTKSRSNRSNNDSKVSRKSSNRIITTEDDEVVTKNQVIQSYESNIQIQIRDEPSSPKKFNSKHRNQKHIYEKKDLSSSKDEKVQSSRKLESNNHRNKKEKQQRGDILENKKDKSLTVKDNQEEDMSRLETGRDDAVVSQTIASSSETVMKKTLSRRISNTANNEKDNKREIRRSKSNDSSIIDFKESSSRSERREIRRSKSSDETIDLIESGSRKNDYNNKSGNIARKNNNKPTKESRCTSNQSPGQIKKRDDEEEIGQGVVSTSPTRRSKTPDSPRKGALRNVLKLRRQKSMPTGDDDDDCSSKHGGESVLMMLSGMRSKSSISLSASNHSNNKTTTNSPHRTTDAISFLSPNAHYDSQSNLNEESLSLLELMQPRGVTRENSIRSKQSLSRKDALPISKSSHHQRHETEERQKSNQHQHHETSESQTDQSDNNDKSASRPAKKQQQQEKKATTTTRPSSRQRHSLNADSSRQQLQKSKNNDKNASPSQRRQQRHSHAGNLNQTSSDMNNRKSQQKRESGRGRSTSVVSKLEKNNNRQQEQERTTTNEMAPSSSSPPVSNNMENDMQDLTSSSTNSTTKHNDVSESSDRSSIQCSNRSMKKESEKSDGSQRLSRSSSIHSKRSTRSVGNTENNMDVLDLGDGQRRKRDKSSIRRSLDSTSSSHSANLFESHPSQHRHQSMPLGGNTKEDHQLIDSNLTNTSNKVAPSSRQRGRKKESTNESIDIQKTRKSSMNSSNQYKDKDLPLKAPISVDQSQNNNNSDHSTRYKDQEIGGDKEKPVIARSQSEMNWKGGGNSLHSVNGKTSLLLYQKTHILPAEDNKSSNVNHQIWLGHVKSLRDSGVSNSRRSSTSKSRKGGSQRQRSRSADFCIIKPVDNISSVPIIKSKNDTETTEGSSSKSSLLSEHDGSSNSSISKSSGSRRSIANDLGIHINADRVSLNQPWITRKNQLLNNEPMGDENSVEDFSLDLGDINAVRGENGKREKTGEQHNNQRERDADLGIINNTVSKEKSGEAFLNDEGGNNDQTNIWAAKLNHTEKMIKSKKSDLVNNNNSSNAERIMQSPMYNSASHNSQSMNTIKSSSSGWTPLSHKSKFDIDSPRKTPVSIRQSSPYIKQLQNRGSSSKLDSQLKSPPLNRNDPKVFNESSPSAKNILLQRHLHDSATIMSGDWEGLTGEQRAWVGLERVLKDSKSINDDQSTICTRDVLPEAIVQAMLNFHESSNSFASAPFHVFHDASDSPKSHAKGGWKANLRYESKHDAKSSSKANPNSALNLHSFIAARGGGDDSSLPPLMDIDDTMTIHSSGTTSVASFLTYLTTHRNVIVQDDQDIEKKDQAIKSFLVGAFNHLLPENNTRAAGSDNIKDKKEDLNDVLKTQLSAIDPTIMMQLLELLNSQLGNAPTKSSSKQMGKIPETVIEHDVEETEATDYGQSQQISITLSEVFGSSKTSMDSGNNNNPRKSYTATKMLQRKGHEDEEDEPDEEQFFGPEVDNEFSVNDLPKLHLTHAITDKVHDVNDFNNSMPSLTSCATNDVANLARPATKWNSEGDLNYNASTVYEEREEDVLFSNEYENENEKALDNGVGNCIVDDDDNIDDEALDNAPASEEYFSTTDVDDEDRDRSKLRAKKKKKTKSTVPNSKKKKKKREKQQSVDPLAVNPDALHDFFKPKEPLTPKTNNKKKSVIDKLSLPVFSYRQGIESSDVASIKGGESVRTNGAREFKRKNYDQRNKFWSLKGLSSMSSLFSKMSGGGGKDSGAASSAASVQGRGDARFFPDDDTAHSSFGNLLSRS